MNFKLGYFLKKIIFKIKKNVIITIQTPVFAIFFSMKKINLSPINPDNLPLNNRKHMSKKLVKKLLQ